jgi:threonine dehydratase
VTELAVTITDVQAAAARIAPYVHRTPVMTSETVDDRFNAEVHFKCENLQKVGAFKARGATNAVLTLSAEDAANGVVTHSSGNHGQAVAYAAAARGIPAWVVMPETANPVKVEAVRGYGAQVVFCEHSERESTANRVRASTGATLVHPFDDAAVIAGQGTAALELLDQVPDLEVVLAPIGGGGLLSGTAVVTRSVRPDAVLIGAEPFAVDDAYRSLVTGHRQPGVPDPHTVADGLLTGIGQIPFDILTACGAEIVRVDESSIIAAAQFMLERMKLVVEPSAATPLAAIATEPERFAGKRVGVIVSGGNTDFAWM